MSSVPRPRIYFKLFLLLILIGGGITFFGLHQLKMISPRLERLNNINSAGALLGTEKATRLIKQAENRVLNHNKEPAGAVALELRSLFSQIDEQFVLLNAEILENLSSLVEHPDPHSLQRVAKLLNKIQNLQRVMNRIEIIFLAIEDVSALPQQQVKVKELWNKIPSLFTATNKPLLEISTTYKIMIKKEKQGLEAEKVIAQKCVLLGSPLALIAFLLLVYRTGYVRAAVKRGDKPAVAKSKGSTQT